MSAPAPAPAPAPPAPVPIVEDLEHDPFLHYENTVVIDGLPNVPKDKCDKFLLVLGRIFPKAVPGGICLPRDENGNAKPFVFVTFHNPMDAAEAMKQGQGYKIDKTHAFQINSFVDFANFEKVPDTYEPPQPAPFVPRASLLSWLFDPRGREQFMVHSNDGYEVKWWDAVKLTEPHSIQRFDGARVGAWSPKGRYFATVHPQGVAVFGGDKFERFGRYPHSGVQDFVFSPSEKYILTFNQETQYAPGVVVVHDVETCKPIRNAMWQVDARVAPFRWSFDDHYLARVDAEAQKLVLYTVPEMTEVEIPIPNVRECVWSPSKNVLAVSCAEDDRADKPASIRLIDPTRPTQPLATKNIFDVSKITLTWHPQGDFLCAQCLLHGRKSNTPKGSSLEIFRMRGSMPVYSVSLATTVVACAWEPRGQHLAVLHGNPSRPDCNMYEMGQDRVTLRDTLTRRAVSSLSWSPSGNYLCLFQKTVGLIEFYSVKDKATIASQNHQQASELCWDPSGRFVTSSVCNARDSLDQGFQIFNYRGDMLYRSTKDGFKGFLWRPRPASVLTEEQQEEVKRVGSNFKRYEEEDAAYIKGLADKNAARRMNMRTSFEEWRRHHDEDAARVQQLVAGCLGTAASGWEDIEEEEIEELDVREQVIGIVDDDDDEGTHAEGAAAAPAPAASAEGGAEKAEGAAKGGEEGGPAAAAGGRPEGERPPRSKDERRRE